jgi:hypothetical protein
MKYENQSVHLVITDKTQTNIAMKQYVLIYLP